MSVLKLPKLTEAEVLQYINVMEDCAKVLNRLRMMAIEHENKELREQVQQSDFFAGNFKSSQLNLTENSVEQVQGQLEKVLDKMLGTWEG